MGAPDRFPWLLVAIVIGVPTVIFGFAAWFLCTQF